MASPSSAKSKSALRELGRFFLFGVLAVGSMVAVAGTLAQLLSRAWWVLELATHFTAHWAVALGLLMVGWALMRQWRWVVVCLVCLAWHVAQLVPLYWPGPIPAPPGQPLRLVTQNVFTHNDNYQAVFDLVRQEDPDVLVLIETNRRWQQAMAGLETDYPHTLHHPSRDNFGISIYSRRPWRSAEVVRLGEGQIASLVVTIETPDGPLQIVATHTVPPVSPHYSRWRNDQLREIGRFVARSDLPTMVVGDLNTTCWSPVFRDLIAAGGLRNTQRGHGVAPTWTLRHMPGIAIDHVLVTEGIAIGERRIGPQIGSDHRAVIIDFALAGEEPKPAGVD